MARHLIFQVCAKIVENIKNIIHSSDFLSQHRFSDSDCSRERKLPFHNLILYFINLNKRSYQDELDSFFKNLGDLDIDERVVTKAALSKARKKLKYGAFVDLNLHLNALFHLSFNPRTWHGFNLLALDGSTVQVPKTQEVADHFGTWKPNVGDPCPMARVSQMFDVLNKITLDAIIGPKETGERELALRHFSLIGTDDIILLDRGYPAFWLFKTILSKKAGFCARIPNTRWKQIKKFFRSGKKEKIATIKPSWSALKRCRELGLDTSPLRLRLIRVELDSGETEILATSLLDTEKYPHGEFSALYHSRWPVEEDYKVVKQRIEVENFSGKSVLSVYQDFHAKVFTKNLTAVVAYPLMDKVERKYRHRQHSYQLNFTQALSRMKDTIILLFTEIHSVVEYLIDKLHELFLVTVEPIRSGRKYPRKAKVQRKGFYPCYKPIR
ncbi:MAG: IS4 family transposase [Proteobacteria bacterium]|nr:IS4 family transposase [Pseudomonadota bacterium]